MHKTTYMLPKKIWLNGPLLDKNFCPQCLFLLFLDAQFIDQPYPGTLMITAQEQVTLTCSVEEGFIIDWLVVFPNGDEAYASNRLAHAVLMQRGFSIQGVATNRSTLSLWETEAQINNETNITCIAQEAGADQTNPVAGNTVQVIFQSRFDTPYCLTVRSSSLLQNRTEHFSRWHDYFAELQPHCPPLFLCLCYVKPLGTK